MRDLKIWLSHRLPINSWKKQLTQYYVPKNLNFFYFFGSLALLVLANQLITGLWLTMFYTPSAEGAFASIEYIMRDVNFGWLFRYMHSTGASAFFIVIYLHLFRALLYGSYQKPRELVWVFGMFLYVVLLAEAFFGYLLPWGQMSYWAAEVITSLIGALPWVGKSLVIWLRGDYGVSDATLHRFFALHVVGMPLFILFLVYLHLVALHQVGSNNPQGIEIYKELNAQGTPRDGIPFHPYYVVKDFMGAVVFLILFFSVVFFAPDMHGYFLEKINYAPANPLVTPDHIAPAWYMAPFYAILRAIPNKLWGIFCMFLAIVFFFTMPWLDKSPVRSMRYKGVYSRFGLFLFTVSALFLGYLGTLPITPVSLFAARFFTACYFIYFIMLPWITRRELTSKTPSRIL